MTSELLFWVIVHWNCPGCCVAQNIRLPMLALGLCVGVVSGVFFPVVEGQGAPFSLALGPT